MRSYMYMAKITVHWVAIQGKAQPDSTGLGLLSKYIVTQNSSTVDLHCSQIEKAIAM